MPLVVISVLFGLSLLGAWVLFAKLKGSASVTNPRYQLGGAAAGFVIILSILSTTYIRVDDKKKEDKIKEITEKYDAANAAATVGKSCLEEQNKEITYSGTVQPFVDDAYVVLSVSEAVIHQDGQDGKFSFKGPHVRPTDERSLYVIGAKSLPAHRVLSVTDDPANLTISH